MKYLSCKNVLLAVCFAMLGIVSRASAQGSVSEPAAFSVFIDAKAEKISLLCDKGCDWKKLSFKTVLRKKVLLIDQSGVRAIRKNADIQANNSVFLFSIQRKKNILKLKGIKGTSWEKLNIECPQNICNETIDQNGIRPLN